MIRQGYEVPDSEFEPLRRVLSERVLAMDLADARTTLAILIGDVPDAVQHAITLRDRLPRPVGVGPA